MVTSSALDYVLFCAVPECRACTARVQVHVGRLHLQCGRLHERTWRGELSEGWALHSRNVCEEAGRLLRREVSEVFLVWSVRMEFEGFKSAFLSLYSICSSETNLIFRLHVVIWERFCPESGGNQTVGGIAEPPSAWYQILLPPIEKPSS